MLNQLRARAKPEDVMSNLESIRNAIAETSEGDVNVDSVVRSIAVQSLLHIGARSFSHFLNAIERYILLLRNLAAGGIAAGSGGLASAEAKADILTIAATFWRRSHQMVGIVFDKFMQYQIVDPTDIVRWAFVHQQRGDGLDWDVLKAAIDKANGRVVVARKRVAALRKEEDDSRARAKAGDSTAMEVDAEAKQGPSVSVSSRPLNRTAQLTCVCRAGARRDAGGGLAGAGHRAQGVRVAHARAKVDAVAGARGLRREPALPHRRAAEPVRERGHHGEGVAQPRELGRRPVEGVDDVGAVQAFLQNGERIPLSHLVARECLFSHAPRVSTWQYSPYLRNYSVSLSTVVFAKIDGATDDAAVLMKNLWNVATGQE